jgi:hypothetical protein
VQGKTYSLPPLGDYQSELLPKADFGSGGGHVGFVPISRPRQRGCPLHLTEMT